MPSSLRLFWNILRSPAAAEPRLDFTEVVEPVEVQSENCLSTLTLQGSHYGMGWQQGDACRAQIQAMVAGFYDRFAQGLWCVALSASLAAATVLSLAVCPAGLSSGALGVAQGAALPLRDILLINFFDDILNLLELGWATACSCSLVRVGQRPVGDHREGQILLSRNLDYNNAVGQLVRPYQVLLRRYPDQGQASVSLGIVGQVGVLTAMNAAGLCLGSLTSPTRDRTWQGLGVSLIYRHMLDQATTVQAALDILATSQPVQGNNLVLATPSQAARVEFSSRQQACTWLDTTPLSITNHYLDDSLASTQTVLARKTVDRASHLRQRRLCALLPQASDRAALIAAMTDTTWPDTTPLFNTNPWQTGGVVSNWGTLHTVIMTPSEQRWDWALGSGTEPIQRHNFNTSYPLASVQIP
ncbi:MAG: hypothetical protein HC926_05720 [Synechococcaceae cyanobacterium SM2_3_60]|nr:hypothetical protein [Synechococcaceae cyanobacterium SM2_3_60]